MCLANVTLGNTFSSNSGENFSVACIVKEMTHRWDAYLWDAAELKEIHTVSKLYATLVVKAAIFPSSCVLEHAYLALFLLFAVRDIG